MNNLLDFLIENVKLINIDDVMLKNKLAGGLQDKGFSPKY